MSDVTPAKSVTDHEKDNYNELMKDATTVALEQESNQKKDEQNSSFCDKTMKEDATTVALEQESNQKKDEQNSSFCDKTMKEEATRLAQKSNQKEDEQNSGFCDKTMEEEATRLPLTQGSKQQVEKETMSDNIDLKTNVRTELGLKQVDKSESSHFAPSGISVYHIKWIKWNNQKTPIITQNENGPCPLIAIMNVLILRGKVKLQASTELITANQLMEYLGSCILEYVPKDASNDMQRNYEQNMNDAMAILPKLQTGLDVNVKFTGVQHFEYTSECILFDLLNITLCHGWLYDPQNPEVVSAVGTHSYNQLVEKIINGKSSGDPLVLQSALVAEQFLESTAAQLTYHGLCEINSAIKDEQLCVFFRNNHFSTLLKHKNQLYHLVTDQGFLREGNVVWETLTNVDGDGHFLNSEFTTSQPVIEDMPPMTEDQQISNDLLIALSLQDSVQGGNEDSVEVQIQQPSMPISDHQLALQLQVEEDRLAAEAAAREGVNNRQQPQQQQAHRQQQSSARRRDCVIV